MTTESYISIFSALIAALSLFGSFIIFKITRRKEIYQNLMDRISVYSGPEMLLAIATLWDFYRSFEQSKIDDKIDGLTTEQEQETQCFLDKYIEIMKSENEQLALVKPDERMEFVKHTLHYHRRVVSFYWRGLALLLKNGLIPRNAVFNWWYREDVEIVPKIIIPMENKYAEYMKISKLNPKTDPLHYLVTQLDKFSKASQIELPK